MTDFQKPGDQYYGLLQTENKKYGDLRFQHVESGITFGLRLNAQSYGICFDAL